MISKLVSLGGTEYLVKYPIGALIMAERKLGFPITKLADKKDDLSFEEMSILVRYGLHTPEGVLVSDDAYQRLIDTVDFSEFMAAVPVILGVFSGNAEGKETEGKSSKN